VEVSICNKSFILGFERIGISEFLYVTFVGQKSKSSAKVVNKKPFS